MSSESICLPELPMNTPLQWTVLQCDGSDAQDFLHRQLTADIGGLAEDRCIQAGLCLPDGRLIATPVVCWRNSCLQLIVPSDLAPTVLRRLQMFVLRDDVQCRATTLHCVVMTPDEAPDAGVVRHQHDSTELGLAGDSSRGLRLSSNALPDNAPVDWRTQTIEAGAPMVYAATSEQLLPQSLRMDQLGGVSFRKGCYPGQEVIARLHYRGQLKRLLVRARVVTGRCQPGDDIEVDGRGVGLVVEATAQSALAVVHQSALGQTGQTPDGALVMDAKALQT